MTRRTLPLIFLAALTLTSCEEGGNEESLDNTEPPIDATTPCGGACLHLFDCLGEICSAEVVGQVVDLAGCVADCEADPDFEPGQLSDLSCTGVNLGVCQSNPQLAAFGCACPGLQSNETNIGDACLNDFDCETGDLQGGCIPGVDPESGEETGFPGGYCTADACLNDAACGEGNFCVPTPRSDTLVNSCLSG